MKKLILIAGLGLTELGLAQTYLRLIAPQIVAEKKKSAVVEIRITGANESKVKGHGFFYGKQGLIVTNHHIMKPWLEDKQATLALFTYEGFPLTDVDSISCSDSRKIDLCTIQLRNFKPDEYFSIEKRAFKKSGSRAKQKGQPLFFIGSCKGHYRIKKGTYDNVYADIVSYLEAVKVMGRVQREYSKNVQVLRTEGEPNCPGDSGGPLFDINGSLWGVTTQYYKLTKSQERFNIFISAQEIYDYVASKKNSIPFAKEKIYYVPEGIKEKIRKVIEEKKAAAKASKVKKKS